MPDDHIGVDVPWRGNVLPLSVMQSVTNADMQNAGDAKSISSVVPEPPQSDQPSKKKSKKKAKRTAPTPISNTAASVSTTTSFNVKEPERKRKEAKTERQRVNEQKRVNRANVLRLKYPTMKNIPKSITPAQRKKLILLHNENAANTLQPTLSANTKGPRDAGPKPTTPSKNSMKKAATIEKQTKRATILKQQYPDMKGIPSRIGQGARKKLIAQYTAKQSAVAPSPHLNELPTRPGPPASTSGMDPRHQFPQAHSTPTNSLEASTAQRPTSYKMAPLSEERRAEVARNLAAGSNDDPVMID